MGAGGRKVGVWCCGRHLQHHGARFLGLLRESRPVPRHHSSLSLSLSLHQLHPRARAGTFYLHHPRSLQAPALPRLLLPHGVWSCRPRCHLLCLRSPHLELPGAGTAYIHTRYVHNTYKHNTSKHNTYKHSDGDGGQRHTNKDAESAKDKHLTPHTRTHALILLSLSLRLIFFSASPCKNLLHSSIYYLLLQLQALQGRLARILIRSTSPPHTTPIIPLRPGALRVRLPPRMLSTRHSLNARNRRV